MDETEADDVVTVGQRLREAREAKGLSVEDVAAQTRIPTRHLTSLEESDWDKLPAATYSVGFAKNYAGVVGLDRNEIGEQLREEMGGRLAAAVHPEVYEAVDPARTMPKGLVISALGVLVLVVLALSWLSNRSVQPDEQPITEAANAAPPASAPATAAAPAAPAAAGPVVLTATAPAWIQVTDGGQSLFSGELAPGQSYTVPATAIAPQLKAGKPEALRINVGSAVAPPVGPAGKVAAKVSLLPADLMRGPTAQPQAAPAQAAPTSTSQPAAQPVRRQPQAAAPSAPATAPAPTNNAAPATIE
jgi:cytoskeletal protein RodZ